MYNSENYFTFGEIKNPAEAGWSNVANVKLLAYPAQSHPSGFGDTKPDRCRFKGIAPSLVLPPVDNRHCEFLGFLVIGNDDRRSFHFSGKSSSVLAKALSFKSTFLFDQWVSLFSPRCF